MPRLRPLVLLGLIAAAAGLTAAPAAGQRDGRGDRPNPERGEGPGPRQSFANPSAVIAAELAFARDAAQRGQWTAFAAAAAPDAVMVVPQLVWAQQWLKGRANPPAALRWQPAEVWSSCDGMLIVSHGRWQAGTGSGGGWFTTLWQRQFDGSYRWVFDHGDDGAATGPEPDMIAAHVADCPPRPHRAEGGPDPRGNKRPKPPKPVAPRDLPPLDPARHAGAAPDGSLRWELVVAPDQSRTLTVTWRKDGAEAPLLVERVASPAHGG